MYKGVATSFGFKRPTTAPSIASNSNAARRLANNRDMVDRNGDTEPLISSNVTPTGRSTPRLVPPKKEGIATRVNRFGFRQPQINRLHKVSDLNNSPGEVCNNNVGRDKALINGNKLKVVTDTNRNNRTNRNGPPKVSRLEKIKRIDLKNPEIDHSSDLFLKAKSKKKQN